MRMPKQGDIIFIDAEPHAGKEFGGHNPETNNNRRPMIVLSNSDYNHATKMVIGMVVTHSTFGDQNWYERFADLSSGVEGNIVLWQLPTYDAVARHTEIVGHVSDKLLNRLKQAAKDIFD
ncbi:type II toxin-antitoxin system PemK/MazF family toxin [Lacticaseibacillus jixiensis]|uniref:type II toxin-antitoxin system PemK/MazF family toxin n=1 Tax=Lacticaseibacillus jixiensis TaxID=3231926 RepID=UPI0036F3235E